MIHSVQTLRGHSSSKMDVVEDLLQWSHEAAGLDAERTVVHEFRIGDSLIEMCVGQKSLTIAKTVSDMFPHRLVSHVPGFKDRLREWPQTMREVQEKQDAPCQRKCCSKFQFLWSFHHWILICWSNPCSLWWTHHPFAHWYPTFGSQMFPQTLPGARAQGAEAKLWEAPWQYGEYGYGSSNSP